MYPRSGKSLCRGYLVGLKGAIAVNDNGEISAMPIPYYSNNTLNVLALSDIFDDADLITIESPYIPHGMANKGTTKAITDFGQILGVAKLVAREVKTVTPIFWKRRMGLTSDKQLSIDMAKKLYPDISLLRTDKSRVDCDGMAESLLILHYSINS